DPSTLCPFCDEPWPENPSDELTALLEKLRLKAWPDPRFGNPGGLKAPISAFINLCQLHRSEAQYIPEGIRRGWPTKIDF
ncbi:hypothetical protein BOTBODRAFT_91809, partial [Botryobasidium botryosum FD-172 SS1]